MFKGSCFWDIIENYWFQSGFRFFFSCILFLLDSKTIKFLFRHFIWTFNNVLKLMLKNLQLLGKLWNISINVHSSSRLTITSTEMSNDKNFVSFKLITISSVCSDTWAQSRSTDRLFTLWTKVLELYAALHFSSSFTDIWKRLNSLMLVRFLLSMRQFGKKPIFYRYHSFKIKWNIPF